MLYPEIFEDVLPVHDRFTECTGAGVPVPESASVTVPVCALGLVKVNVALAATATVGLNVTVKGTLWPAEIVTGSVSPLTVNTELFELAAVTVTLAPVALSVPEPVPVRPATMLPRFILVGVTESCPAWLAEIPVPVRARLLVAFDASLVIVAVALNVPGALGVNETVTVVLCPDATVAGRLGETSLKYCVEIATLLTVTEFGPEFDTTT